MFVDHVTISPLPCLRSINAKFYNFFSDFDRALYVEGLLSSSVVLDVASGDEVSSRWCLLGSNHLVDKVKQVPDYLGKSLHIEVHIMINDNYFVNRIKILLLHVNLLISWT